MNNKEFSSSKLASKQESQAWPMEVQLSATRSEPLLRSPSPQPETRYLLSFTSSEEKNVATRNETNKTISTDVLESIPAEAMSFSVLDMPMSFSVLDIVDILRRIMAYADESFVDAENRFIQPPSEGYCRESEQKMSIFTSEDFIFSCASEPQTAGSCREKGHPTSCLKWVYPTSKDFDVSRDLVCRFWDMMTEWAENNSSGYRLVITDRERSFFEKLLRSVPSEIPAEIADKWNIPSLNAIFGPVPEFVRVEERLCSHPSAPRLRMALAKLTSKQLFSHEFGKTSRTSKPETFQELFDSQPSFSAFENKIHKSRNELAKGKQFIALISSEFSRTLGEHSSARETLERESANSSQVSSDVPP